MNVNPVNASYAVTCWRQLGNSNGIESAAQKAALGIFIIIVVCNVLTSAWCAITTFTIAKLRKPTWIFK